MEIDEDALLKRRVDTFKVKVIRDLQMKIPKVIAPDVEGVRLQVFVSEERGIGAPNFGFVFPKSLAAITQTEFPRILDFRMVNSITLQVSNNKVKFASFFHHIRRYDVIIKVHQNSKLQNAIINY